MNRELKSDHDKVKQQPGKGYGSLPITGLSRIYKKEEARPSGERERVWLVEAREKPLEILLFCVMTFV